MQVSVALLQMSNQDFFTTKPRGQRLNLHGQGLNLQGQGHEINL